MSERASPAGRQCRTARARARGRAPGAVPRSGVGRGGARALCAASRSFAACRPRRVPLAAALTRVLAHDVVAAVDAPPFDRSNVDGFALRAADTLGASDATPKMLRAQRRSDRLRRRAGARGRARHRHHHRHRRRDAARRRRGGDDRADRTDRRRARRRIELRRAAAPGQFISYAGSDIARGETLLRRGARIGSREIGMLAACGLAQVDVVRRPKVAVLSTGDELVAPGAAARSRPASTTATAPSSPPRCAKPAASRSPSAPFPTTRRRWKRPCAARSRKATWWCCRAAPRKAPATCRTTIVSRLGKPGILVHGVALKPGKPLCLAVVGDKPIVVLPGFPTSAIFTFHAFVAPVIRARAGLPPEAAQTLDARVPVRVASELGRKEFVLVSLVDRRGRPGRVPDRQGLRLGDQLLAGRRLPRDRRARFRARCRQRGASDADRQRRARARSGHHGQPRRGARRGGGRARRARLFRAHAGGRQPRRRGGGEPRRMRHRAGASDRSGRPANTMCIW